MQRLKEIEALQNDWCEPGSIPPLPQTIKEVKDFLRTLSEEDLANLDEDCITPTPYGSITIEFSKNLYFINIEFGKTNAGFFAILPGEEKYYGDLDYPIENNKELYEHLKSLNKA